MDEHARRRACVLWSPGGMKPSHDGRRDRGTCRCTENRRGDLGSVRSGCERFCLQVENLFGSVPRLRRSGRLFPGGEWGGVLQPPVRCELRQGSSIVTAPARHTPDRTARWKKQVRVNLRALGGGRGDESGRWSVSRRDPRFPTMSGRRDRCSGFTRPLSKFHGRRRGESGGRGRSRKVQGGRTATRIPTDRRDSMQPSLRRLSRFQARLRPLHRTHRAFSPRVHR